MCHRVLVILHERKSTKSIASHRASSCLKIIHYIHKWYTYIRCDGCFAGSPLNQQTAHISHISARDFSTHKHIKHTATRFVCGIFVYLLWAAQPLSYDTHFRDEKQNIHVAGFYINWEAGSICISRKMLDIRK